jgi:hypothetical protein
MFKISNTYDVTKHILELKQNKFIRLYDHKKKKHIQFQLDIKSSSTTRIYYNMLLSDDMIEWKFNMRYLFIDDVNKMLKKILANNKPLVTNHV